MKNFVLIVVMFALLSMRYAAYERSHVSPFEERDYNVMREIIGIVTEDPDRGLDRTRVVLGSEGVLVTLPSAIGVSYGDRILVRGKLSKPEPFMTETGRQFDYDRYLAIRDIYATMRASDVTVVSTGHGSALHSALFAVRRSFVAAMKELFPSPESGLLAGILVGEKSLLPDDVLEDFQVAGLTHIIVLSGHNITLVIIAVTSAFAGIGFGYRARRVAAIAFIPLFLIMTGLGASSLRAGIMAIIALLLQIDTRPAHTLRIVGMTVFVTGMMNPRVLLYDPSFHLSLLAFMGLTYAAPLASAWTSSWPRMFGLVPLLVETAAVQAVVLPYMVWMSGQMSFLILLSNLLVVPLGAFIMAGGFASTMLGWIWFPLGAMISWPVEILLSYVIWVSGIIGSVDMATLTIPPFSGWVVVLIYSICCGFFVWMRR